jgi:hypothetical protein
METKILDNQDQVDSTDEIDVFVFGDHEVSVIEMDTRFASQMFGDSHGIGSVAEDVLKGYVSGIWQLDDFFKVDWEKRRFYFDVATDGVRNNQAVANESTNTAIKGYVESRCNFVMFDFIRRFAKDIRNICFFGQDFRPDWVTIDTVVFARWLNQLQIKNTNKCDTSELAPYINAFIFKDGEQKCLVCSHMITSVYRETDTILETECDIRGYPTPMSVKYPLKVVPFRTSEDYKRTIWMMKYFTDGKAVGGEVHLKEGSVLEYPMKMVQNYNAKGLDLYFHAVQQWAHPHYHAMTRTRRHVTNGNLFLTTAQMTIISSLLDLLTQNLIEKRWSTKSIYADLPFPLSTSLVMMEEHEGYLIYWASVLLTGKFFGIVRSNTMSQKGLIFKDKVWDQLMIAVEDFKAHPLYSIIKKSLMNDKLLVSVEMSCFEYSIRRIQGNRSWFAPSTFTGLTFVKFTHMPVPKPSLRGMENLDITSFYEKYGTLMTLIENYTIEKKDAIFAISDLDGVFKKAFSIDYRRDTENDDEAYAYVSDFMEHALYLQVILSCTDGTYALATNRRYPKTIKKRADIRKASKEVPPPANLLKRHELVTKSEMGTMDALVSPKPRIHRPKKEEIPVEDDFFKMNFEQQKQRAAIEYKKAMEIVSEEYSNEQEFDQIHIPRQMHDIRMQVNNANNGVMTNVHIPRQIDIRREAKTMYPKIQPEGPPDVRRNRQR